jgi:hypothetical protein
VPEAGIPAFFLVVVGFVVEPSTNHVS